MRTNSKKIATFGLVTAAVTLFSAGIGEALSVFATENQGTDNMVVADTVVNLGKSMLDDASAWTTNQTPEFLSSGDEGNPDTVSYDTTGDLVRISKRSPDYSEVTYSFSMKLAAQPKAWLAYIGFRTTEYDACPWESYQSKSSYWLEFNAGNMVISKHDSSGRNNMTEGSGDYAPGENFFVGAWHDYTITMIDEDTGTHILVYVDNVKAIDVHDSECLAAGGFRVLTHNQGGGGLESIGFRAGKLEENQESDMVVADTVVNLGKSMLDDASAWITNQTPEFLSSGGEGNPDTVSYNTTGDLVRISKRSPDYSEVTYSFSMKLDAQPKAWLAYIGFRTTEYDACPWESYQGKSSYWLEFNAGNMVISKHDSSGRNNMTEGDYAPGENFFVGAWHDYTITMIDEDTGTHILVYVDNVKAIDVHDSECLAAGGFRVLTHNQGGGGLESIGFRAGKLEENQESDMVVADTVVNLGKSMLDDASAWTTNQTPEFLSSGGEGNPDTVSYNTTGDLVRISKRSPDYSEVTYSFSMKLDAQPKAWLAYIGFRTTEYDACPWESYQGKSSYWLEFNAGNMVISKHDSSGRNNMIEGDYAPGENFFVGAWHDYTITMIDENAGTHILVYVDNVKAIDVHDSECLAAGGFRVLTHNQGGGGLESIGFRAGKLEDVTPKPDDPEPGPAIDPSEWEVSDTIVNLGTLFEKSVNCWNTQNAAIEQPTETQTYTRIRNLLYPQACWANLSGMGSIKYQDATINMKLNFGTSAIEWLAMISFRDSVPGIANWGAEKKSAYDIQVNRDSLELRRLTGSSSVISRYTAAGLNLLDGNDHEFCITTLNEETGVHIIVYLDGVKAFDTIDTAPVDGSVADAETLMDAGAVTICTVLSELKISSGSLEHTEIKDTVPPVITANLPLTGKVGEEIILPAGVVTDDYTDAALLIVQRTVTDPDGNPVELRSRRFTPQKAGAYRIVYTVTDEAGNVGKLEGTLTITAADEVPVEDPPEKDGLSGLEIGLIVASCIVVIAAGVAVAVVMVRRGKKKN